MPKALARTVLIVAVLLGAVACGYDTNTTFNADGTVTVGLKFLFPNALMQGGSSGSVQGFTAADISKDNATLASKYPGAKVTLVTTPDESGAAVTIPFKTEKDAFAFMTTPSTLNPSGSSSSIDLSNTGGLFAAATHTADGQADTYTFKTQPAQLTSPSPGSTQSPITADELASIFSVTFSLTVPHEITSAPGALFTLDRKTAIWKLSWTQAETLTATTGPSSSSGLAGVAANGTQGQSPGLVIVVGLVAIALGLAIGVIQPWLRLGSPAVPVAGPALEPAGFAPPSAPPAMEPPPMQPPGTFPGPPSGMPPPWNPPGS